MDGSAAKILKSLASKYGVLTPDFPTDPYQFLIWWHCGYPQSQKACVKGWTALTQATGIGPEDLLEAKTDKLVRALRLGGMVPELRAMRLKQVAERILKEFDGDLGAVLRTLPLKQARAALVKFPGIANPGADRILLFGGIAPIAAVPSNCVHVLVRLQQGPEEGSYAAGYRMAQQSMEGAAPATFEARTQTYLLLRKHGQDICKRTNPRCAECVVQANCRYYASA